MLKTLDIEVGYGKAADSFCMCNTDCPIEEGLGLFAVGDAPDAGWPLATVKTQSAAAISDKLENIRFFI